MVRTVFGQRPPSGRGTGGFRKKRKELPEDVAQGVREQTDFEKFQAEQEPVEPKVKEQEREEGVVRKTAEFGLGTAAFTANVINKLTGNRLSGGKPVDTEDIIDATFERFPKTSHALGLTTTALEAYSLVKTGAKLLGKTPLTSRVAPNIAKLTKQGGRARITRIASGHRINTRTGGLVPVGTRQTQRGFLGKGMSPRIAKWIARQDQVTLTNLVRRGLNLAKTHPKTTIGGAVTLGGINAMWYWGAADNIVTAQSIYSRDIAEAARFGTLSKSEALNEIDDALMRANIARIFMYASNANPLVFATGGSILLTSANSTVRQIKLRRRMVEGL